MSATENQTAPAAAIAEAEAKSDSTTVTALRWLLSIQDGSELADSAYMDALFKGAGPFTTGSVRRYLQLSGKKVAKIADGVLAMGMNVAALKELAVAIEKTGERIGLGDALVIVKSRWGVEIPPEVVRILELASR